jgi:hypothetical protein
MLDAASSDLAAAAGSSTSIPPSATDIATTRQGVYWIAVAAFYLGRARWRLDKSRRVWHANLDKKIIQFLSVELTCATLGSDQILTLFIKRWESQGHTQLSVLHRTVHSAPSAVE